MKQYEAVIKVMEKNGGFTTLAYLNQNVLKEPNCQWNTKTPFASIRRIVQDKRFFFKIKPGLWALKSYENKLPDYLKPTQHKSSEELDTYSHSYYQGLIIEIGNFKNKETFVANQDKNKTFLGKKLADMATIKKIYEFGYKSLIKKAQTIDVIWFNERKMPDSFFEIEHSTNFSNSLVKFSNFQDYYAKFTIVADEHRKKEFENILNFDIFSSIKERVKFLSYEDLAEYHSKASQFSYVEKKLNFK